MFLYVAQRIPLALNDGIGRAGDSVAQIVELRIPDRVSDRLCAGRGDDRFGRREGALLRLGRGDLGFGNGLDCGGGRVARMQNLVDSPLNSRLLINEPDPDE